MFQSRMKLAAALLAFGALAISPAMAGGKNGGDGGGHSKNGGGCSGNCGGGGGFDSRIVCIVNGHRFETNAIWKCYPKRHIAYRYHFERKIIHRKRHACGCAYTDGGSYGGSYGYSYGYTGGGSYGGSYAARMQAQRRGVAMTDGGVYYGQDETYGFNDSQLDTPRYHGRKMRRHYNYGGYEAGYTYDPGYVIHYGPTISKDGGY